MVGDEIPAHFLHVMLVVELRHGVMNSLIVLRSNDKKSFWLRGFVLSLLFVALVSGMALDDRQRKFTPRRQAARSQTVKLNACINVADFQLTILRSMHFHLNKRWTYIRPKHNRIEIRIPRNLLRGHPLKTYFKTPEPTYRSTQSNQT
jgi:hypothetical protein